MSFVKRILAAVISCAVLLGVCSCGANSKNAMKFGDEELPSGIYIYYVYSKYLELTQAASDAEYSGDIWDYTYEDKKASDWIKDEAKEQCTQLVAIERKFKEMNLSFTDEEAAGIESNCQMYWAYYKTTIEELGISYDSYSRILKSSSYGSKIVLALYGEGGSEEISKDDLTGYMNDNYYRINYIYLEGEVYDKNKTDSTSSGTSSDTSSDTSSTESTESTDSTVTGDVSSSAETSSEATSSSSTSSSSTSSGSTEPSEEAVKLAEEAEKLFADAKECATDADFIELIKKNSDKYNAETDTDEDLALGNVFDKTNSSLETAVLDKVNDMKNDEIQLVAGSEGWYIVKRYALWDDGLVKLEDYSDNVITSMKNDTYQNELTVKWASDLRENENISMISASEKRYTPEKIAKRSEASTAA